MITSKKENFNKNIMQKKLIYTKEELLSIFIDNNSSKFLCV